MTLSSHRYGKSRVRVLRMHRSHGRHELRELTIEALLHGDFARLFTHADNALAVSTDTVRNVVNVVARENLTLTNEAFCRALAARLFETYGQVDAVDVTARETRWSRLEVGGAPHPHAFTLDGNGQPVVELHAARGAAERLASGVSDFTFLKATQSGWAGYAHDRYTTLPETDDRIAATSLEARWHWSTDPADFEAANARVLAVMLEVFAGTYSHSVQDSLYRMATAALDAVPEVARIDLAAPNKHYLPVDLSRFGLGNDNQVFVPTDEPHGQIECSVTRG